VFSWLSAAAEHALKQWHPKFKALLSGNRPSITLIGEKMTSCLRHLQLCRWEMGILEK